MHVCNLVTNDDAPFYRQQLDAVAGAGVETTTLSVSDPADGGDRSPLAYAGLVGALRRRDLDRFDLVHANYGLTAPAALAQRSLPVVISLWGSDLAGPVGRLSRICARLADATIVMTREMAGELGRPARVLPHPVDLETFRPRPQESAQDTLGWDPETLHVLFPYATERTVKDYPRAARIVRAARPRLSRPVRLRSVSGEPHHRVATYMNAADALLLTSRREGSPNAVKEALACNLPVVATDVGDVGERLAGVSPGAVRSSDAGLVEALVATLRAGQRSDGRDAVRSLGIEAYGERLREIYEGVLDGRARPDRTADDSQTTYVET
jgi:hypothetical protein